MLKIIRGLFLLSAVLLTTDCKKTEKQDTAYIQEDTVGAVSGAGMPADRNKDTLRTAFRTFSGAWFQIEYPAGFTAQPSLKSATAKEGFDSATFTSPDGKVRFYVFSPQWSGEAADIAPRSDEKQTAYSTATENGLVVKRWTLQGADGSYFRSYEATSETGSVNKVFGIKYASTEDLEKYRGEYLHFKNSLEQYAD